MSHSRRRAGAASAAALLIGLTASAAAAPARAAEQLVPKTELANPSSWGGGIGDFNGDGLADVATDRGVVIFGNRAPERVDTTQPLGAKGLRITTSSGSTAFDFAPTPLGDIDADGYDDVAFSASYPSSVAHVVYGGPGNADIQLKAGPRVAEITANGGGYVAALGDWDGDGIDDFTVTRVFGNPTGGTSTNVNHGVAVIRGGKTRLTTLNALAAGPRVQPITAQATCVLSPLYLYLRWLCLGRFNASTAPGDFDGDGKADLFVISSGKQWILRGRTSTAAINTLSPTDAIEVKGPAGHQANQPLYLNGVGDVNGDGRDDSALSILGLASFEPSVILGRTGTGTLDLATAAKITVDNGSAYGIGDVDGDGRDDVGVSSPDNKARYFTDFASRGPRVNVLQGTEIPYLEGSVSRLGGDFDGDGKTDLLGSQLVLVSRGNGGPLPDTKAPVVTVVTAQQEYAWGDDIDVVTTLDEPASVRFDVLRGDDSTVATTFTRQIAAGEQTFSWAPTNAGGAPLDPGAYRLRATPTDAAGNTGQAFTDGGYFTYFKPKPDEGTTVPPFAGGSADWEFQGAATQTTTDAVRLTAAKTKTQGLIATRKAVDPTGWKYSFTAKTSGGNGAAEGLALSFVPENASLVGAAGLGGLGIGGLGASGTVVVALDQGKGTTGPADQFLGISDGTLSGGSLVYQQTADPGLRMRAAAFKVDVTHQHGVLVLSINGKPRLTRTVALPSRARIVFSAATGASVSQEHLVSGFTATRL